MKNIRHIFFDLDNTLWDHRKNAKLTLEKLFEKYQIQEKFQIKFEDFHNKYDKINEHLWQLIRDEKIDKEYLRKHRFYDTFLHFDVDDFELAQIFEHQFLDEIIAYNELIEGSIEILEYLKCNFFSYRIHNHAFNKFLVTHINTTAINLKIQFCFHFLFVKQHLMLTPFLMKLIQHNLQHL